MFSLYPNWGTLGWIWHLRHALSPHLFPPLIHVFFREENSSPVEGPFQLFKDGTCLRVNRVQVLQLWGLIPGLNVTRSCKKRGLDQTYTLTTFVAIVVAAPACAVVLVAVLVLKRRPVSGVMWRTELQRSVSRLPKKSLSSPNVETLTIRRLLFSIRAVRSGRVKGFTIPTRSRGDLFPAYPIGYGISLRHLSASLVERLSLRRPHCRVCSQPPPLAERPPRMRPRRIWLAAGDLA